MASTAPFGLSRIHSTVQYFVAALALYYIGYFNVEFHWTLVLLAVWLYGYNRIEQDCQVPTKTRRHLPSWVLYPDVERAEWLNTLVAQMWPYMGKCFDQLLKKIERDPAFIKG